jgi:hypothetical protein
MNEGQPLRAKGVANLAPAGRKSHSAAHLMGQHRQSGQGKIKSAKVELHVKYIGVWGAGRSQESAVAGWRAQTTGTGKQRETQAG